VRQPPVLITAALTAFVKEPPQVLDLCDITASRGLEMWLPLWPRLMDTTGTPAFNLRIVAST
jgi:hypothetical protein